MREPTPDPFSPSPADPLSPESSPDIRHSQDMRHLEASESMPSISLHHPPPDSDEEGGDSQLFPGSDLF